MTPLQKIAMGMVIVSLSATFPANPSPEWKVYDALPNPIGWVLVVWGVWALGRQLDADLARWTAVVALVVSGPLWFPQVNHHLLPGEPGFEPALTWAAALPAYLFGVVLSRTIGKAAIAQEPRDSYVASRFGILTYGYAACVALPVIAYSLPMTDGTNSTLATTDAVVVVVQLAFAYYLFRVHRRTYLGGPGPLEVLPRGRTTKAAPDEPERPS